MRLSARLIEQLIGSGKASGLSASDIAVKAGISPSNLSRIRRTGRFNADTLERLLAAVDVEVRFESRVRTRGRTLSLVASKLNAGRRENVTVDELRRLLTRFRSSATAQRAFSHLVGVIEELPLEQLHSLVVEGDATLPSLKRIADFVEGEGETAEWIDEQLAAGNALARAPQDRAFRAGHAPT
ncbi:MAG: helix-turn-helix domain-containing protein [Kiloniellales bacterium]